MKNLFYLFIAIIMFGCSNDDCSDKRKSINETFDKQIQHVKDNPGVDGIDYRQISLMEEERDKKLDHACD